MAGSDAEGANHFAEGQENTRRSDEEIVLAALDGTADEKLSSLALRFDGVAIPHENQPGLLSEAEQVFAPKKPKAVRAKGALPLTETTRGEGLGKEGFN
jgi:ParB family transcriptional regulator, chromosome partitioning protein